MKFKSIYSLGVLFLISGNMLSQVGINTSNPQTTLDVVGSGNTTAKDGLIAPRLSKQQLAAKVAGTYGAAQTGSLVYVTDVVPPSGTIPSAAQVAQITAIGYHQFDGTEWKAVAGNAINIYNSDGSLTGNRMVTQAANTLAFTSTATNGFSVDGTTFSVDAANDRIGVGTAAPETKLHVVASTPTSGRYNVIDAPQGTSESPGLVLRNTSVLATANKSYLGFSNSGPTAGGANWQTGSIRTSAATGGANEDFYIGNSTGGSLIERLRILPVSGNVGIGISIPTNKLDVRSSTAGAIRLVDGTEAAGSVLTSDANGVGTWQALPAVATANIYNTNGSLTGNRVVTQAANTLAFTSTATNGFSVDGTTFSVDAANDRIGIGTAAPVSKLDIVGDYLGIKRAAGSGSWDNLWIDLSTSTAPAINASGADTGLQFKVGANTTGTYGDGQTLTTVATMRPNGDVGIGTATPNSILDLGTSNGGASVTDATGKKFAVFNNAGGTDFYGLGINTNYLQFHAGSAATDAPGMVLGASGNLGIGSTAPNRKLHVEGAGYFDAAVTTAITKNALDINIGQDGFAYGNRTDNFGINVRSSSTAGGGSVARINFGDINTTTAGTGKYLSFSVGNGLNELMYLTDNNSGRVGIGTTTPTEKLHVIGNILASGTITPSDIRIKKDIVDNAYGLNEIMKLRTINYRYKDERLSKDKKVGFVAQEIQKAMPELVSTANDEMKTLGVNYAEMTVVLTKAVQQQQELIKTQQAQIDELKTKLEKVELKLQ